MRRWPLNFEARNAKTEKRTRASAEDAIGQVQSCARLMQNFSTDFPGGDFAQREDGRFVTIGFH
jgi:hypothetical protein